MPCKLLYVIQVKGFLIKCSTSWPYLISEFLVAYITIVASDWPLTFLQPGCFCLAYTYIRTYIHTYVHTFIRMYKQYAIAGIKAPHKSKQ